MERIRLVHVTTIPITLSFLRGQARHVGRYGFEVHAISSPSPMLDAFGSEEGVRTYAVEMERRITPLRDCVALVHLWRRLRALRPHIVHAHTPKAGLLGTFAAWVAGVPVRIYHVHGLAFMTAGGSRRRLLRWTERASCALATRVISVSESVRRVVLEEELCPATKIVVLGAGSIGGVDARGRFVPPSSREERRRAKVALGFAPDARVIGFVGRLVRDKGIVELAHAWLSLREMMPDLQLLLVGPFEPQDPVPKDLRATLERDPRVHLTGLDCDTPKYYRAMDVLALPTHREGFGTVILEAAAMEVPVVATRIPGCVDSVVDGRTGTLVPARDPGALAAALRTYLDDPGLRRAHGVAGRQRVLKDFQPERVWEELAREYLRLCGRVVPGDAESPAPRAEGRAGG